MTGSQRHRLAALLLWFGIAALGFNAMATHGHRQAKSESAAIAMAICTPQGLIRIAPDALTPVGDGESRLHENCCELCAACAAPAAGHCHPVFLIAPLEPEPRFRVRPTPPDLPWHRPALAPLVPRGPPKVS